MKWHTDYLLAFTTGCTSTLADFSYFPRSTKSLAARAIMEHAQWLTESTGKGTKAAKREAVLRTIKELDFTLPEPVKAHFRPALAHNVINPHD